MTQKKKKIARKKALAIYSVGIAFLMIFPINTHAEEDLLAGLKNPFISKLPEVIREVKQQVNPVQAIGSNVNTQNSRTSRSRVQPATFNNQLAAAVMQPVITMPSVTITGVLWNSVRPQAIVNGNILGIGEKVGEAEIINIGPSQVVFKVQTKTFTITVE